jgi:hypothetical protein
MREQHGEVDEHFRHRLRGHRAAAVGVEGVRLDPVAGNRIGQESRATTASSAAAASEREGSSPYAYFDRGPAWALLASAGREQPADRRGVRVIVHGWLPYSPCVAAVAVCHSATEAIRNRPQPRVSCSAMTAAMALPAFTGRRRRSKPYGIDSSPPCVDGWAGRVSQARRRA